LRTLNSKYTLLQNRSVIIGCVLMISLFAAGEAAVAQQEQDSNLRVSTDKQVDAVNRQQALSVEKKSSKTEVSDKDRAAAMRFASENHPELARLLEQLEKSRSGEFSRAVRELTQQIQALERFRERSPARYETQLEAWKRGSQIRVLMARWSRSQDPELEKQVRELLTARREARVVQLRSEQVRIAEQLRKIEEQLAAVSQPVEPAIEKEWEQLSKKSSTRKSGNRKLADPSGSAAAIGTK
jgi:hypothetical protein